MRYSGSVILRKKSSLPRIVHLVTDLRLAGTQKMLAARVAGCPGFEHHVWAPELVVRRDAPDLADRLRAEGARLYVGRSGTIGAGAWFVGAMARARWQRPAIVHSCLYHTHLVSSYIAVAAGARLVLSKESTDDWMTPEQAKREVSIARDAAVVVAVSRAAARVLEDGGRLHAPVRVIPCGIPPGPPSWAVLNEPDDAPRIVYVGRLDPAKGLADLVEAVWRLLEQGRRLRLQVQGDGPAEAAMRQAFTRAPLAGRARLITHADARGQMRADDSSQSIFVLPSHFEGFGIVLLEAMRQGLPIVATRVGGIPEVVEENCQALLVPPRDPQALAAAIARLLDDANLRARLAAAGPERADRFTEAAMCRAWRDIYAELLEENGR